MTLTASTRSPFTPGLPRPAPVSGAAAPCGLAALGARSDHPEVQARIRDAIRRGTARVRPAPGCPDRVMVSPAGPDPS